MQTEQMSSESGNDWIKGGVLKDCSSRFIFSGSFGQKLIYKGKKEVQESNNLKTNV